MHISVCETAVLCTCKHTRQVSDYLQKLERFLSAAQRGHIPGTLPRAPEHKAPGLRQHTRMPSSKAQAALPPNPLLPMGNQATQSMEMYPGPKRSCTKKKLGVREEGNLPNRRAGMSSHTSLFHLMEKTNFPDALPLGANR